MPGASSHPHRVGSARPMGSLVPVNHFANKLQRASMLQDGIWFQSALAPSAILCNLHTSSERGPWIQDFRFWDVRFDGLPSFAIHAYKTKSSGKRLSQVFEEALQGTMSRVKEVLTLASRNHVTKDRSEKIAFFSRHSFPLCFKTSFDSLFWPLCFERQWKRLQKSQSNQELFSVWSTSALSEKWLSQLWNWRVRHRIWQMANKTLEGLIAVSLAGS